MEINNFAAASIFDGKSLNYSQFRNVYREASRFTSRTLDAQSLSKPFSGDNGFLDMNVSYGNTYYYRIRAVGINGDKSNYAYAAIKFTSVEYDYMIRALLSTDEINFLTSNKVPLKIKGDYLHPVNYSEGNSFSILPSYTNPSNIQDITNGNS